MTRSTKTPMRVKTAQSLALWQIYLFISLSFVIPVSFAQADPGLAITLDVPPATNSGIVTVNGMTRSNARVFLNVGDPASETDFDATTVASTQGNFLFPNVQIGPGTNTITVLAINDAGDSGRATATVTLDQDRPDVQLDEVPANLNSTTLTLQGNANEAVTVLYTVTSNGVLQTSPPQAFNASGAFSVSPALENGDNEIAFTFTDLAGNSIQLRRSVRIDTTELQILEHNLDQLDPSYSQQICVRGKVSKPGTQVVVFVNGESHSTSSWSTGLIDTIRHLGKLIQGELDYSTTADSEGYFSVDVFLSQELSHEEFDDDVRNSRIEGTTVEGDRFSTRPGDSVDSRFRPDREFENDVKIVAVDDFGHTATATGVVRFAKCGTGGEWNIKVGQISPAIITPELLRLGMAKFSFAVELHYQG